ncbi:MAG: hypothetical protein ACR2P2_08775 [Nakamurella sp.]
MTLDDSVAYTDTELDLEPRWWDAAYLTVGQSYLGDNALLREPLTAALDHPAYLAMLEVRRWQHRRRPRCPLSPRRCRSHRQLCRVR